MKYFLILLTALFMIGCSGEKATVLTIQPDGNKMEYLNKEFTVKSGEPLTIIMDNTATLSVMKHNVVVLNDKSKINEVGQLALTAENYIPDHPAIIAATPLADAGGQTQISFNAPETPGEYVFICTTPGHYSMMQGIIIVE